RDEPLYTQNYPLNSGKGSAYEGGIREPMIVRWPGVANPGSRCATPLIIEDFFPAILEIAGIRSWNVPQKVDGKSFVPLLRNPSRRPRHRFMVWNYPNIWGDPGPGIGPTCTIRMGDWKLIHYYADGHDELFNIAEDIGETVNLAAERPRTVKRLCRRLGRYLRKVDAQRPSLVRTGAPCPWPDEM
ncbi:MAG: sulfatase-like hydrolase/transferase, partial [Bacteroidales bacterium]|nr:sulfatase-like hydrolase/transferase [Bacteroidales bacterium]